MMKPPCAPSHTDHQVAEEPLDGVACNKYPLSLKFGDELPRAETVLRRVLQKRPVEPAIKRMSRYLFKKEAPSGLEYARHLLYFALPFGHVMNNREVEDGIERLALLFD